MLDSLFSIFLRETPPRLSAVREAVDRHDPTRLAREAHALKSGCASLGAGVMVALCADLEALGRSGGTDGAHALIDRLDAALEQLRPWLVPDAWPAARPA
jgi:HPt (histidine-containing phosphotransfer) domain-containing protein